MPFRLRHPLATYPRVKNLFERAPFGRVSKYYRSKFSSIQVPLRRKDLTPELTEDFLFHLWKFRQCVRCHIGIEEFRRRYDLSQAITKRAFARGNSARDPDRRHRETSPRRDAFGQVKMEGLFHFCRAEGQFRCVISGWEKPFRIITSIFSNHVFGRPQVPV